MAAQPMLGRKRQEGENEDEESSLSSKKQKGLPNRALDDLGDDELIQIFCRLPMVKFAFGLMSVSKRWYSLISSPYFVSQFTTHHINNKYPTPTTVFITSYKNYAHLFRIAGDDDSIFESHRGYALEFLPEDRGFVTAVASCNDLLYCRVIKMGNRPEKFYVCNPLTMQWFRLPPPPDRQDQSREAYGLVCDPNYQLGQQYECRFRVVHIIFENYNFCLMDTFCSEIGQWNEPLRLEQRYLPRSNVVAHNGKLHWFNGPGVVVYDPFSNNVQSIGIDRFDSDFEFRGLKYCRSLCVGVCQGMVRFMELVNYEGAKQKNKLTIWELEDYASGRLSLKHRNSFSRWHFGSESGLEAEPLAFHPNNKDVVYVAYSSFIISCKIQRGKLEVIGKTLNLSISYMTQEVLTSVIPWWPTPLPQNAHGL